MRWQGEQIKTIRGDVMGRRRKCKEPEHRKRPPKEIRPWYGERHGCKTGADEDGGQPPELSVAAVTALRDYQFPGNVRELENILERALALCGGDRIEVDDLQLSEPAQGENAQVDRSGLPLQEHLDSVEKEAILKALEQTRYNKTRAAELLGMSFRQLRYRVKKLGIE